MYCEKNSDQQFFFAEQRSADCSMQNEEGNEGNKAEDR